MKRPSLTSVLIANRGEIACRIIRTARALGMRTIAVYSSADQSSPHVSLADEAVLLGPAPVGESYLRGDKVIAAALQTGAEAIHPGYGFLSENADFAREVNAAGLVFIGPPPEAIEAMGNKAEAKRLMTTAGVPCVPGYQGKDQSNEGLIAHAKALALPVMIKAAAGGGGRGMRLVHDAAHLEQAIQLARHEAENAFGSGELIIEKAILSPRHVEIQVLADAHGNIVHLGERDCSVQRRHQKVIEEAPCPVMTQDLRVRMGKAAVDAARTVNYQGVGTVEFLLDNDGAFYFLEMNTRLQVEHPVTELVTGLDLVEQQFLVANGAALPISQSDVRITGHAIEARLYAEDPANGYLPATGHIDLWRPASGPGLRVDDGIASGLDVSPFYDAMLAKVIAYGETREIARARLIRAVQGSVLLGVETNSEFLVDVLTHPTFADGLATTALLEEAYPNGFQSADPIKRELALATACLAQHKQQTAFARAGYISKTQLGWASVPMPPAIWEVIHHRAEHDLAVQATRSGWIISDGPDRFVVKFVSWSGEKLRAVINDTVVDCVVHLERDRVALAVGPRRLNVTRKRTENSSNDNEFSGRIVAPMPGVIQKVAVQQGEAVTKGETLVVLEAMKMQHALTAPIDGVVTSVFAETGKQVNAGEVVVEIRDDSLGNRD